MNNIYIERQQSLIRVAIKDNEQVKECFVEEENNTPKIGEIYKGIVKNIVATMKCAFIDVGYNKNCYMPLDKNAIKALKKGDEVLVEVTKEEIDKKGPKVSSVINIPGTYVVINNSDKGIEISRKISREDVRNRIKEKIQVAENLGVVVRTKCEFIDIDLINEEIIQLGEIYNQIHKRYIYSLKPGLLYSDRGIISRVIRNYCHDEKVNIILNNEDDYNFCNELCHSKNLTNIKLELYRGPLNLFDYYDIERQLICLRHNKINLPSGGNIVIEKTEAMHVIDVNTAQNSRGINEKENTLITNIEAANEIVNQVRLRNLGGIILVDFVNMIDDNEKEEVLKVLKKGFFYDKNNPVVYPFTDLNLVQISRRRYGRSICEFILEKCRHCKGTGNNLKLSYISNIIKGKVNKILLEQQVNNIYLELNSSYEKQIREDILGFIASIGSMKCNIYVTFIENIDNFRVEPVIFHSQLEKLQEYLIYKGEEVN